MRDRNHLDLQQFNIQLAKTIFTSDLYSKILKQEEYFSHKTCLWRSDTKLPNSQFLLSLPRDFRLLRSLSITLWWYPEVMRTLYLIEMREKNFSHLNAKQQMEISIYLSSKENCLKYLYLTQRYSGSELFGNLLGNDLKDLSRVLKIRFRVQVKARRKVFRRGPKDYGSRRSDSTAQIIEFEEKRDVWLAELEIVRKTKNHLLLQTIHRILLILENFSGTEN